MVAWLTGAHCSNLHLNTATALIYCYVEQHIQVQEARAKQGRMKYRNTFMTNLDVCGLFVRKILVQIPADTFCQARIAVEERWLLLFVAAFRNVLLFALFACFFYVLCSTRRLRAMFEPKI